MKRGAATLNKGKAVDTSVGIRTSSLDEAMTYKKQSYVTWNKEMDNHLANVLMDQMALGNKCDGDTWKPQALQAAVTYLNSTLHLSLTKDNIKNRLKYWKKCYNVVSDVRSRQSGFSWSEDKKMIVVTSDEWSAWTKYVESHPDAKGMHNKEIPNLEDIAVLCGKDRANGLGAETFEEALEEIGEVGDMEANSTSEAQLKARPSSLMDFALSQPKKAKKDSLGEAVGMIANAFQEFVNSKKKMEEKPSGFEIHEVVSKISGLTDNEVFKGVRKLMNGDPEEFKLLKALPEEKKNAWVLLLNGTHDRESSGFTASHFVTAISDALNRTYGDPQNCLKNTPSQYINTVFAPKGGQIPVDVDCLAAQGIIHVVTVDSVHDSEGGFFFDPKSLIQSLGNMLT